ncbi:MAG: T9SS type A sorting domain-containing protein [Candidatus Marinimicrobia bacterium]|nr:T9SS type A sorting domain-containing protein [Candidatus Neomarinimicrobiota bacterium]MCF7828710.1 T9SS type A sorting domain-containing protein [Candidatus Neomarinimicrobiota bacterium]MCF7880451.1 T9SS type A sorting domain-containing protein [Candidatus Neomarinimicrobiota bacterium]
MRKLSLGIFLIIGILGQFVSARIPPVIEDLQVYDAENAADWQIRSGLEVGDLMYGDREYTISSLPDEYTGLNWIQTANDSKEFGGDTLATFQVTDSAAVYVAFDDRVSTRAWMDDWEITGDDLVSSETNPISFSLYRKDFNAGETVAIGPVNQGSGASNLILITRNLNYNYVTPDPFEIATQFDVARSSDMTSEPVTLSGLTEPTPIRISNPGSFSINDGQFQSEAGTVESGDQVQFHLPTPSNYSQVASSQIAVGDYLTNFTVRTIDNPDSGWAQVPEILDRIQPPTFPDRDYLITDYGADPTGQTKSTEAINAAIDSCSAQGGGRVVVPADTFLTGAIHLKSNVNLHLREGAVVQFSTDPADYLPVVYTRFEGTECKNYSPFIYAYEQENIAITGKGTLDGQADYDNWWAWKNTQGSDVIKLRQQAEDSVAVEDRIYGEGSHLRPNMIQPYRGKNILIEDVTVLNGAMWHIHPVLCENVTVRNVTVRGHGPNNDGCNPESSKDVLIDSCLFDTGDDCVAIKAGRNADGRRIGVPSENIIVQNSTMYDGHGGVVIGSEMTGGARNIFAQNCYMDSPSLDRALRIKTNSRRGGFVENVYFKDIEIGEVARAVVWVNCYYSNETGDFTPTVRNVKVENVTSQESDYAVWMRGLNESPVSNIRLINCNIQGVSHGNSLDNVANLSLQNVTINDESWNTILEPVGEGVTVLGTAEAPESLPDRVRLLQNYPNPFNASTTINYSLAKPGDVSLTIYDISGRKVTTLTQGHRNAGSYSIRWDGRNVAGISVGSGIYFYRITVDGRPGLQKRMVLLK